MRTTSLSSAVAFLFSLILLAVTSPLVEGGIGAPNEGSGTPEDPYVVPRTDTSVRVDGVLDDEAWENALVLELNYEVQPGENVPPPVRTEVLLTYDEDNLYAAFRAYDPDPSAIRVRFSDRDHNYGDDFVGIVLDTFNDERRSFFLWSNAVGVQEDAIMTENDYNINWDTIYDSVGCIFEWGYAVEMVIPFSSLRFQRSEGNQIWGFNARRNYPRDVLHCIEITPRDRSNNCYLCQASKIEGFDGATPGRNIEITPTLTALRADERSEFPDGDFETRKREAEAGITTSWGITPSITLSATANPDFSQVEADALQLDINQPFALYYPEKRQFFTEGTDFFTTRFADIDNVYLNAVYTRTIRDPLWGFKLTGKEGANTIGAFFVRDEITNILFPGNQGSRATSLAMANSSAVFRYKRDIGSRYTLGVLATDREGDDYFNRLLGFTGDFRITDMDRLQVVFLHSATRYPDEVAAEFDQQQGSFGGTAFDVNYQHFSRTIEYWARYQSYDMGFRADLGFRPRVDFRHYRVGTQYNWNARPGSWYSRMVLGGEFDIFEDQEGNILDGTTYFWWHYFGPMQSHFGLLLSRSRERYNNVEFDQTGLQLSSEIRPTRDLHLGFLCIFGDRIDYDNTMRGKQLRLNSSITYNVGRHLRLSVGHDFERLNVDSGRLYTANISQATAVYQFNTRTFLRSILQYVDYCYNAGLYTFEIDPQYRHLFTQFLFSYKLNPRTVLFIGYSDNHVGSHDFGITQADRTFFVKLGYAWVL